MRKISKLAAEHFMKGEPFSMGDTLVYRINGDTYLSVHGNIIAARCLNGLVYEIRISTCGWNTKTTLDRLNAIPKVNAYIRNGVLYLNGLVWDGLFTQIP